LRKSDYERIKPQNKKVTNNLEKKTNMPQKLRSKEAIMNTIAQAPIRSTCKCGQIFFIEHGAGKRSFRADGKRIFYEGAEDSAWSVFRCDQCGEPVDKTVPGAEYSDLGVKNEHPPNLWVAEDPTQPGTAFAIASTRFDQRETLGEWEQEFGVVGRMVNTEDALRMLNNWDRSKSTLTKSLH
jgi:hypothetical protein